MLLFCGGWGLETPPETFAQFEESVHELHVRMDKKVPGAKKNLAWAVDFLQVLRDHIEDIDQAMKFMPYKVVSKPLFRYLR